MKKKRSNICLHISTVWLDIFLCRALAADENLEQLKKYVHTISVPLVQLLKMEIGSYVQNTTLAAEDLDQLKRYVYSGRGWKLLCVLDKVLFNLSNDPPFLPEEETKELTDLLISLYQVIIRIFNTF